MALSLFSCDSGEPGRATLRVAAASSLRRALEEIAEDFEMQHPEIDIAINSAASGVLRRQIERGNAADLFISANERHMRALVDSGRVVGEPAVLCGNRLVAGTPDGQLLLLADLIDAERFAHIAIGNPATVPLGEFAKETLVHEALWEVLEPQLVFAENAGQISAYLRLGSVDAVITYASEWLALGNPVDEAMLIDDQWHSTIRCPMAVVSDCEQPESAALFMEHLLSEGSQLTLERWGFRNVP